LVATRDSEIDTTFANEARDIGSWEKDERNREVETESNVEARVTMELDVATVK